MHKSGHLYLRNLWIYIFIRRLRRFTQIEDKTQELYEAAHYTK